MIEVVDFEDETVDIVIEGVTLLGVFVDVFDDFFHSIENTAFVVGAESKLIKVVQRFGVDMLSEFS